MEAILLVAWLFFMEYAISNILKKKDKEISVLKGTYKKIRGAI